MTDRTIALTGPARRTLPGCRRKSRRRRSNLSDPHRVGKELKLGLAGLHSARRGEYRVIYRIAEDDRRVDVVTIEHRADAYRPHGP